MIGVVLGGLVTTTLVNVFVTPALYLRFSAASEPDAEPSLAEALQRRVRIWVGKGDAPEVPVTPEVP